MKLLQWSNTYHGGKITIEPTDYFQSKYSKKKKQIMNVHINV